MAEERDWKDLPPELIHLISHKLTDLRYFIRCHAVCKRWFSSTPLSDPPRQQLPWLIEYVAEFPHAHAAQTRFNEELRFYSFASGETGSIPIHLSHHGKNFHRPGHSYLLVRNRQFISLFNPLTNKVISLPQLKSPFCVVWPVFGGEDPSLNWRFHLHLQFLSDPESSYCATYHPDMKQLRYVVDNNLSRTCYWLGMLFATEGGRSTLVFDAASGKKLYTIPRPKDEHPRLLNCYIVESCGVILRVSWYFQYGTNLDVEASNFFIYALSFEGGSEQPCWVKVSDIGNQIVFLDFYNGFSARATAGIKGNCIYFLVEDSGRTPCNYIGCKLWRYNIGTGTVEIVPCPFERCTWFVPSLH